MQTLLAILLGKLISKLTRGLKIGGGSAAPGLYALKIDPNLVSKLSRKIPKNVVITGTNGKTTTARMIAHFAKESGLRVIRNQTGSNLERGIASTLIASAHLRGGLAWHLSFNLGIWELDEAAFNSVTPKLNPDIVIFLNVFRDQLDRYGEVDSVVKKWCQTLKSLTTQTVVLVNGDDANTAKLEECFKGKVISFGVKDYKLVGESLEKKHTAKKLDFEAEKVRLNGLSGSSFNLRITNHESRITLPLPGIYHIYDALAAIICAHLLSLPINQLTNSLVNYQPAFGRVEKIVLNPTSHRSSTSEVGIKRHLGFICLIKNPAGATQVFETIAPHIKPQDRLLLALNDNSADGTDVSWIWDTQFERLIENKISQKSRGVATIPPPRWKLIASGARAYDLANRLKYAGFDAESIKIEVELKKALQEAKKGLKGTLFILPTYTAMLKLQRILARMGIKRHYWEEE